MATKLLKDADTFEFLTDSGRRLDLFGESTGWQDEIATGLVEHRVVKRNGALHQNVGAPPRRFVFACVLVGADVHKRYQEIVSTILENPLGFLIHPRFGFLAAVCEGISAKETPGEAIDTILFSIKFAEDGLREPPTPSPSSSAAAATAAGAELQTAARSFTPAAQSAAAAVAAGLVRFAAVVAEAASGGGSALDLLDALRAVGALCDAVLGLAPAVEQYALRAAAALVYARALEAYNAVRQGLPAVITYRVPGPLSVPVLAARLYGGRFARAQVEVILRLNRLARPYRVPAGTLLLLYDPRAVLQSA